MGREAVDRCIDLIETTPGIDTVDITGGAPELHPDFRRMVATIRSMGRHVIDRCNLTVLGEPGQEDTSVFLADQRVEVVASLPCYGPENVNQQRGAGVFEASINQLRKLNQLGYGEVIEISLWLTIMYTGKSFIDEWFNGRLK